MELVTGYRASPGSCLGCGNSDPAKKVIDLRRDDPNARIISRIYVCEECVLSMATLMLRGTSRELVDRSKIDKIREVTRERNEARDELARLRVALAPLAEAAR